MPPITWQNVNGPALPDAGRLMGQAQQSFDNAFSGLDKTITNFADVKDERNVQSFLDRIQKAGTQEQVAAMQSSGELDAMRAAISNPKNLARIRGAEDLRIKGLRENVTADRTFNDAQVLFDNRGAITQAQAANARGEDGSTFVEHLKDNPVYAKLVQEGVLGKRATEEFTSNLAKTNAATGASNASTKASEATTENIPILNGYRNREIEIASRNADSTGISAGAAATNANTNKAQANHQAQLKIEERLADVAEKTANLTSTVSSKGGFKEVLSGISHIKDEREAALLSKTAGDLAARYPDASPKALVSSLLASIDKGVFFGTSTGETAETRLKAAITAENTGEAYEARLRAVATNNMLATTLKQQLNYPTSEPAPLTSAPTVPNAAGLPTPSSVVAPPPVAVVQPKATTAPIDKAAETTEAAAKLVAVEKSIREQFKKPEKFESAYNRVNRVRQMNEALDAAKASAKPIDEQTKKDRESIKAFKASLSEYGEGIGNSIADRALFPFQATTNAYNALIARSMRAVGIDAPNASPMFGSGDSASFSPNKDALNARREAEFQRTLVNQPKK